MQAIEDPANIPTNEANVEVIPNMDDRIALLTEKVENQTELCLQLAKLVDVLCQRCNVSIDAILSKEERD